MTFWELERAVTRTKPVPEPVASLISRINLLPFGLELKRLGVRSFQANVWSDPGHRFSPLKKGWERWAQEAFHQLSEISDRLQTDLDLWRDEHRKVSGHSQAWTDIELETCQKSFLQYIWGNKKGKPNCVPMDFYDPLLVENEKWIRRRWREVKDAVERYESFLQLRFQIEWTIRAVQKHCSWVTQFEGARRSKPSKQQSLHDEKVRRSVGFFGFTERSFLPFAGSIRYSIGVNGKLEMEIDEFTKTLCNKTHNGETNRVGKQVDIRRIRSCLYCSRIFCAGRVDSFCCSSACVRFVNQKLLEDLPINERRAKWREHQRNKRFADQKMAVAHARR